MPDITLSNADALSASDLLAEIAPTRLPAKCRFALDKIAGKLTAELVPFRKLQGEALQTMLAEGKAVVEGQMIRATDVARYLELVGPLLSETITLSGVRQVTLDEFGDVALPSMAALAPFMESGD